MTTSPHRAARHGGARTLYVVAAFALPLLSLVGWAAGKATPAADKGKQAEVAAADEENPAAKADTVRISIQTVPPRKAQVKWGGKLLGTKLMPDLAGAILFFEEVGERPYRIDRLLTHLELGGVFERVAAVVVGDLVACEEPADSRVASPSALEVVRERLGRLSIPVALGARIGHGERNLALPYGARAQLDTAAGTLVALEAPVS